jgi:DNA invertase Pin-like site-specific DNA recombinase
LTKPWNNSAHVIPSSCGDSTVWDVPSSIFLKVVEDLNAKGIGFASLTESIDTTTSNGKLIFHIFCSLAEFERNIIRERTIAGLAATRARGRKGGRKQTVTEKKITTAQKLADTSSDSIADICTSLGISRSTYYRRTRSQ